MADLRLSTPIGEAIYPRLQHPDTKFDELGAYKADVAIDLAEAEPLMKELSKVFKSHTGKAPVKVDNTMWIMEVDEGGEQTGRVVFKLRIKNRLSKKTGEVWDRRPAMFDASLKPCDVNPYTRSKMIVSFDVYEWKTNAGKAGVSLQPVAVQIIELVTGTGPSGASFGFGAQEGSFSAPEKDDGDNYADPQDASEEGDDEYDDADY